MIVIVDCGMGNLHSVTGGLRRAGGEATIVTDAAAIDAADKVILPGDGHFGACMNAIDNQNLRDALVRAALNKPFLGICIGMQALFEASEEAPNVRGLSVFKGQARRLTAASKIPHIGWNTTVVTKTHRLLTNVNEQARFYFIHSYYLSPDEYTILTTEYGEPIAAAVARDNIIATQFHPEKSAQQGEKILKNFVAL